MKKIATVGLLALVAAVPAMASEGKATLDLTAASNGMYRGQSFTNDRAVLGANLGLRDLVVNGTFVNLSTATHDVTNLNDYGTLRSEVEVGYGRSFGRLDTSVSVARVIQPVIEATNYSEARVKAGWNFTQNLSLNGEYNRMFNTGFGNDQYMAVGVSYKNFLLKDLTVSATAASRRYAVAGTTEFNNAELTATYAFNKHLEVFGGFSFGGKNVADLAHRADINFVGTPLRDQGWAGVTVKF
jgi:hypothetical protein